MATPNDQILVARLRQHVDRLAGLIGPRHLGRPRSFNAAAKLVESELANAGYTVVRRPYYVSGQEVANLVAELPGRIRDHEIVVVGAHYDTVATTPGADDNASAVAVMIEVARIMRNQRPNRTVRFVGFACEEPPHYYTGDMGSQVYARECRAQNEQIKGMLCLEMVGYYTTIRGSQGIPSSMPRFVRWALPHRGNFLVHPGEANKRLPKSGHAVPIEG